ncbi:5-(carboxyamino)imidazole ribonucleotide synthase [Alkalispirochaeta americana]|uniref:N5-carboxyaminoimidazole ribonucleotide synthase n=1 Tax=Alkalispirochaeta americana TaxID=159291 RepID=A0A1N6T400_9SPIO|nr:5-(carboxyamino)imidazole ribonucleotide synthase [Alkalispirochaeta americana]SIQ48125.1 5-(carboxyamino)imidazole ribonucleotide synthase [Alkalispirochaeta americana]
MKVGILGGGQLARMLALAGHPLGIECVVLDPSPDACAQVATSHIIGSYEDNASLERLVRSTQVVTYEFENVPSQSVRFLEEQIPVYPPAEALALSRDRLTEKGLFRDLGIPTVPFAAVDSREALVEAVESLGLPALVKTRCLGYDGKGQVLIRSRKDISRAWESLGGVPCILEGFAEFSREVSIVAVRSRSGEIACYPLSENTHQGGILHYSCSCEADPLQQEAEAMAGLLLERLCYVGTLALELFVTPQGLVANEMAPRVHNTGHWTIEGAGVSQFENHLRAVAGFPLGDTSRRGHSAMVNFIGAAPAQEAVLKIPHSHYHSYGKSPRPGRKIGHGTICAPSKEEMLRGLEHLLALAPLAPLAPLVR